MLIEHVLSELKAGTLQLPRIPGRVLVLDSILRDEDSSIKDILKAISSDISLAARVLQVANSAWYWSDTKVTTLQQAVARLGTHTIHLLLMGFGVRDTFKSMDSEAGKFLSGVWEESLKVACLSMVLAKTTKNLSKDTAFLVGLIHRVGVLPVVAYYEKNKDITSWKGLFEEADAVECEMAAAVLTSWNFPLELTIPVNSSCSLENRSLEGSYAEVLMAAKYFYRMSESEFDPVFSNRGLRINFKDIESVQEQVEEVSNSVSMAFT